MLDLQTALNNAMVAARQEELKNSPQILLGELILKLEAVQDKQKPVVFDFGSHPTDLGSWRGSYCELALGYTEGVCPPALGRILDNCKAAFGETFQGYKGGDYVMGKATPVWVANYGESGCTFNDEYQTIAIVDVLDGEQVTLITKPLEY